MQKRTRKKGLVCGGDLGIGVLLRKRPKSLLKKSHLFLGLFCERLAEIQHPVCLCKDSMSRGRLNFSQTNPMISR